ncbi:MAG: prepilin-type N-terminal cleavage/methylation domain-containing protein [Nostocaceae cyanobacterium]|nr:prepilin-type N-terminal cleavage/methylation domain-containing protein [Nostocaceae cyanobacterium]
MIAFKLLESNISNQKSKNTFFDIQNSGFTLMEVLVVVFMVAILSAIVAPSWLGFVKRQRLNKTNDMILAGLQEAQREAKKNKRNYSFSLKTTDNIPKIAIHSGDSDSIPADASPLWRSLTQELNINKGEVILETNLISQNKAEQSVPSKNSPSSSTPQTITFDYMGTLPNADFGKPPEGSDEPPGLRVVVAIPKSDNPTVATDMKRCVIVKTLIGNILTAKKNDCSPN